MDIPKVATAALPVAERVSYAMRTAKKRQLRIVITQEADVAPNADKGRIARVVIEIPAGIETTDPTVLAKVGDDTL